MAAGNSENGPAGGAGKEFIILALNPTLITSAGNTHNLKFKADKFAVFLSAAVNILGHHPEIYKKKSQPYKRLQILTDAAGKYTGKNEDDYAQHQQENIQLVMTVSADHKSLPFFSHEFTLNEDLRLIILA